MESDIKILSVSKKKREADNRIPVMGNWTAIGVDNIHNYWWKSFDASHEILAKQLQEAMNFPSIVPTCYTLGKTSMISKSGNPL